MKHLNHWFSALALSMAVTSAYAQAEPTTSAINSNQTATPVVATESAANTETAPATEPNSMENALQTIGEKVNDAAITTTVVARLSVDPLIGPFVVSVETKDGAVTLSGNVDSQTQYQRALMLASGTKGVTSVDAKGLTVTPSSNPVADAYITTKIKAILFKDQYFNNENFSVWDIHVETNNGVVFLVGQVKDATAKNRVMEIVSSVDGVKSVEADLQVTA